MKGYPVKRVTICLPMDEAKLMDCLYSKGDLCHVEASDVFSENFVLDEHRHQITARQEFHQHVEERAVLESGVKFDNPWTVGLSKNIAFRSDVSQLILFELLKVSL